MKNFFKNLDWGLVIGSSFLIGLLVFLCWGCVLIFKEEAALEEKNLHAPCSEFFSSTMDKVPARCVKEYLKN